MNADNVTRHISVLLEEVIEGLAANAGGDFLDCTLGGAGHSEKILEAHPNNTVLGCDRDARALERAGKRLARFGNRVSFAKATFSELEQVSAGRSFDGLLADLGVSTDQLFEERGFSFRDKAALDMRMDEGATLSAAAVVNEYSERELIRILKVGGVGATARSIARAIIRARPIGNTAQLAEIVSQAGFDRFSKKKIHPATIVFQALRMEVNQELTQIETLLEQMPRLLKAGGRAAVISFHSGEDKLIAGTFRRWAGSEEAPAWWMGDRAPNAKRVGKLLQNDAVKPSVHELETNPAARSARLRVFLFDKG